MSKLITIACLSFALLLNLGHTAFSAGALPKLTAQYWDELYDLARTTLKITVSKGDDFVRFIQKTDNIDDIMRLMTKVPTTRRAPLLLEICAVQGKIRPTDVLRLQPLLKTASHADDVLIAAMRNGDDVATALRAATQVSKFSKLKSFAVGATSAIASTAKIVLSNIWGFGAMLVSQFGHILLTCLVVAMGIFWKFFAKIFILLFRLLKQAIFLSMRK